MPLRPCAEGWRGEDDRAAASQRFAFLLPGWGVLRPHLADRHVECLAALPPAAHGTDWLEEEGGSAQHFYFNLSEPSGWIDLARIKWLLFCEAGLRSTAIAFYLPRSPDMPGMKVLGTRGGMPAPMNPTGGGITIGPFGIRVGCGERASG